MNQPPDECKVEKVVPTSLRSLTKIPSSLLHSYEANRRSLVVENAIECAVQQVNEICCRTNLFATLFFNHEMSMSRRVPLLLSSQNTVLWNHIVDCVTSQSKFERDNPLDLN